MNYAQVVAETRIIAGGKYFVVNAKYHEFEHGDGSLEWSLYVDGVGWTEGYPEAESALEGLNKKAGYSEPPPLAVKKVGSMEVA